MSMSRGFQRVVFSQSAAAQFALVEPPAATKKIRVRGCILSAVASQDVTFESNNTTLSPANLSENYSLVLPPTDGGVGEAWLECAKGEALNITLGQAVQTDGVIFYDVV